MRLKLITNGWAVPSLAWFAPWSLEFLPGALNRASLELESPRAEDSYYNLLVQGFRAGQLNVKREAPPGLTQLADPYDPAINASYVWDMRYLSYEMSYYRGKLYLYFGVTPALVLFWPYAALTGHYLLHKNAVVIFYALGFLVAAGLLRAVWRRYFPEASVWVAAAGILALGLATGILEVLSRCDVYEVAISCGFAFTMLALAAIWRALHEPKRKVLWLLMASLAYGLAIGARPSLLFGVIILLMPVAQAWRAATGPSSRRRIELLFSGGGRSGNADWVGADALQYPALRQPIRIWLALSVDELQAECCPAIQSALPLVQLSSLFFRTNAMEWSFPFFASCPAVAFAIGSLMGWENLTVGY